MTNTEPKLEATTVELVRSPGGKKTHWSIDGDTLCGRTHEAFAAVETNEDSEATCRHCDNRAQMLAIQAALDDCVELGYLERVPA